MAYKLLEQEEVNIILNDCVLDHLKIRLEYRIIQKYYSNKVKDIYIFHIISLDTLKISNVNDLLSSQAILTKALLSDNRNICKENSIFYTIFEFKNGINMIPDLRMHYFAQQNKTSTEDNYNVFFNGIICLIYNSNKKYRRALEYAIQFFARDSNIKIANTYEEAVRIIEQF